MSAIIGREKEIEELKELYNSDKSEFVAVYGRRRVGKTFLVDEALPQPLSLPWMQSKSTNFPNGAEYATLPHSLVL